MFFSAAHMGLNFIVELSAIKKTVCRFLLHIYHSDLHDWNYNLLLQFLVYLKYNY